MALKSRDHQTQVKHRILSSYMDAWSGIIINGTSWAARDRRSKGLHFRSRLIYVDGFSYKGRYAGDSEKVFRSEGSNTPTWGSPILGIQALDRAQEFALQIHGFHVETVVVLVEDDADDFKDLKESLELASCKDRIVVNPRYLTPQDGQIVAIHGDFLNHLDSILRLAQDPYAKVFFLLDPYGPKGIPFDAVSRVICQRNADVMINFPYQDLHKKQGILDRIEEKPADQALLANYDLMYGTREWRQVRQHAVAAAANASDTGEQVEAALTDFYLQRLLIADPTIAAKQIDLQFRDRDRTMFYLYLTTHDPSGALKLNEVLHEAKLTEHKLKWHYQQARWLNRVQQTGQMLLMDIGEEQAPAPPDTRTIDIPELATYISETFQGQSKTLRQVYTMLANSVVFASEVNKAMTHLKRHNLAEYDKLQMDTPIRFRKRGSA